jgi:hypothetical protein
MAPEMFDLTPQQTSAGGMKGTHPNVLTGSPKELLDAAAHLFCRLVGKGQGQDLPWGDTMGANEVGDTVSNDSGFTGAGPRQDQQGAIGM